MERQVLRKPCLRKTGNALGLQVHGLITNDQKINYEKHTIMY